LKLSQKIRIAVDMAMILLLPVLMACSLVGEAVHEWLGITMFLLFLLHHALNWRWHKNIAKGHYSALRIVGTVINGLLAIIMVALPVSGIVMARHTFQLLDLQSGMSLARTVHLLASHWGLILMSLHFGLHWNMILGIIKKAVHIKKSSTVCKIVVLTLAVLLCLYGVYAFIDLQFGTYLFLQRTFVFFDFSKLLIFSLVERVGIMCLFFCIGYYGAKISSNKKERRIK
jgi:hypothetical protein